jgi:hypothetical protein
MEIVAGAQTECPYCGSDSISGQEVDVESMVRVVDCKAFSRHWQEYLKVYTIYIPDEYVPAYQNLQSLKLMSSVRYKAHLFNPQPKPESRKGKR